MGRVMMFSSCISSTARYRAGEIGNLLPNNRRQRRTCYALCHILYPVSAAHTSIFRMDSNSTSYLSCISSTARYRAGRYSAGRFRAGLGCRDWGLGVRV